GRSQHQPWHPQSSANSHPGRRQHPSPLHGRNPPPRFQPHLQGALHPGWPRLPPRLIRLRHVQRRRPPPPLPLLILNRGLHTMVGAALCRLGSTRFIWGYRTARTLLGGLPSTVFGKGWATLYSLIPHFQLSTLNFFHHLMGSRFRFPRHG